MEIASKKTLSSSTKMLWRPTNFEKHSSLRRMATIAVLFLQSFALRIAIGLYFAVISIFVLIFVLICVLPLSLWADSTFAGRNDVVLAAFLVCLLPTLAAVMFVASKLEQRRIRHEIASWVSARSNLIVANGYQQWEQRANVGLYGFQFSFRLSFVFFSRRPTLCFLMPYTRKQENS